MDHLEPTSTLQLASAMPERAAAPAKPELTRQAATRQTAEYGCVDWFPYLPALGAQSGWFGYETLLANVE
jgi:hypothetical protein